MSGKPVISSGRVYRVMAQLSEARERGESPFEIASLDRPALAKAMRRGYMRPARFAAPGRNPRPAIIEYAITADGKDFMCRVENEEEEAAHG